LCIDNLIGCCGTAVFNGKFAACFVVFGVCFEELMNWFVDRVSDWAMPSAVPLQYVWRRSRLARKRKWRWHLVRMEQVLRAWDHSDRRHLLSALPTHRALSLQVCCFCSSYVKHCDKRLKVKGLDFYIPPLTGKPWPAAVYNSNWHTDRQWQKWHSTSSGIPLPEWMDFGPHSLQPDRPTYAPASRTVACSLAM